MQPHLQYSRYPKTKCISPLSFSYAGMLLYRPGILAFFQRERQRAYLKDLLFHRKDLTNNFHRTRQLEKTISINTPAAYALRVKLSTVVATGIQIKSCYEQHPNLYLADRADPIAQGW
jgi:hypothetical protein